MKRTNHTGVPIGAVAFATLGCKVNQAESEQFARGFAAAGLRVVSFDQPADAYIINSCTVTHVADRKSRQLIRQARRANPAGLVVATGCYAAVSADDVAKTTPVDLIVPNGDKERLVALVLAALHEADGAHHGVAHRPVGDRQSMKRWQGDVDSRLRGNDGTVAVFREDHGGHGVFGESVAASPSNPSAISAISTVRLVSEASEDLPGERTRSFVKVQDGCDSLCSFCVIPYARGRERSVPIAAAVAAVGQRLAAGHQEVVLTGVHLGTYGADLVPRATLRDLLEALLVQTAVPRLRLSSVEPWNFDPAILDLWDSGRLCRHFHLALQSGSDSVLQRMRRPYGAASFTRLLEAIRARLPDAAITTDVIVGFPGETEDEFKESLRLAAALDFALVHVFPYSPRRRTPAAKLPGQVPTPLKRARMETMLEVAADSARRFRRRFLGRTLDVLYQRPVGTDDRNGTLLWEGISDNYIRVLAPANADLTNRIVPTVLVHEEADGLRGRIPAR